jgi:SAM-dependent methyltransferase
MYYEDKLASLTELFGTSVRLDSSGVIVGETRYPILDDVIILSPPSEYTPFVRTRLGSAGVPRADRTDFADDIQYTFGEEWKTYGNILPEHQEEFARYFDIVDLADLKNQRLCDLGCGIGRWSFFLADRCREIVLVDFSDAVFVARENLRDSKNALFFMGDITRLPFKNDFADLIFCLGVLHHLPTPCLEAVRSLKKFAPRLLVFLYYALDNRPAHYRLLLRLVTSVRGVTYRITSPLLRKFVSFGGAVFLYKPLVWLGFLLKPFGLASHVPLFDFYHDKSLKRIEQDVYDRFFTRIEQRVTRAEIMGLKDAFSSVRVSDRFPYWHFVCDR